MGIRQHTTPVIVEKDGRVRPLDAIPLNRPPFREARLQELLADHPKLLPIGEIEPAFQPLVCLGREIGTKSGPLDILYSSPNGYLTLVETKLWDNPDARRLVVGQIVDYAKDLAEWTFEELDEAVLRASGRRIIDHIRKADPDVSEAEYVEHVSRNLRKGRFLLLIAGNGIREGVESMAKYLQQTPSLHFTLALVELSLYSLGEEDAMPLLIQPRIVARTAEITRAIVEVKVAPGIQVDVSLPADEEVSVSRARKKLTEDAFYEELAENISPEAADAVKHLVEAMRNLGCVPSWGSASVSMRLPDPGGSGNDFTVIVLQTSGTFYLGWLEYVAEKGGYDPAIAVSYRDSVSDLTGAPKNGLGATVATPFNRLFLNSEEFLQLVEAFASRLQNAAGEGAVAQG